MANSAVLVMDVQQNIVDVANGRSGNLPRLRQAMGGSRAASIPVLYVVIGLRRAVRKSGGGRLCVVHGNIPLPRSGSGFVHGPPDRTWR